MSVHRIHRPSTLLPISSRLLLLGVACTIVFACGSTTTTATADPAITVDATTMASPAIKRLWVLAPPIVTIVLAIWWRQVIPALVVGILTASYLYVYDAGSLSGADMIVGGLTHAVEGLLIEQAIADIDHVKIVVFTMLVGGMVGIIAANGGTAAIVGGVARWASNRRRGQLATWLAGLLVFFDDYANAMIVGPSLRPVCDRLRISRAKLAYLVDSTAAPVASIAIIGTWIGAEIGFIHDGLQALRTTPAFLADAALDKGFAYDVFIQSIPYRFYPLLALVFVFMVGLFNRDFGPMRRAEHAAITSTATEPDAPERAGDARAWYAGVPVLVLVFVTLGLLLLTGWMAVSGSNAPPTGLALWREIVSGGDAYNSILYGALAATFAAVLISLGTGRLTLAETMNSMTASMARMLSTIIVLILAWTLSAAMQELALGEVARDLLREAHLPAAWLPLLIFLTACVVSFATGTSWGTMGILCPAAVTISAGLLDGVPADDAVGLFYASVGAVLAGAVFGDHCSPISDTTVLSSVASECSLEQHVWTQMPYALVVAGVSILCGDVLCRQFDVPVGVALLIGVAALALILLAFGGRPASPAVS